MSILVGLYTPTSGAAYIAGHDVATETELVRPCSCVAWAVLVWCTDVRCVTMLHVM